MSNLRSAYILAGGKGERLRPLTLRKPKPLLKIGDKPILQHQIEWLKSYGIEDFTISIGYLAHLVKNYFGDGEDLDVRISYINEEKPMGTGGSLPAYLQDKPAHTFVMLNGDNFIQLNLDAMFEVHKKMEVVATMALTFSSSPEKYGTAMSEGNYITAFFEKDPNPPSSLINAGAYIIDSPKIVDFIPVKTNMIPVSGTEMEMTIPYPHPISIERDIFPNLAAKGLLAGYTPVDVWLPVDTVEAFYAVGSSINAFRRGYIE